MTERLACPECAQPVDRLQPSSGVVAVYPCLCWLSLDVTRRAVKTWRDRVREALC